MALRSNAVMLVVLLWAATFGCVHAQVTLNFGQSCALTGDRADFGLEMNHGIMAAFTEANAWSAGSGVIFNLTVLDDAYTEVLANSNTKQLVQTIPDLLALIGQTGSGMSQAALDALTELNATNPELNATRIPFIGPLSGARALRVPFRDNIINLRASFIDETDAIVRYLVSKSITRISILYQNDSVGFNAYDGLQIALAGAELQMESFGHFEPFSLDVETAVKNIFEGHHVEAIVMMGTAPPLAKAIDIARTNYSAQSVQFFALSYMNAHTFEVELVRSEGQDPTKNIYSTQVVPAPANSTRPFVLAYQAALKAYNPNIAPTFKSLEGYMVGRFVVDAVDRIRGSISRESLLDAIYRSSIFALDGLVLGPFSRSSTAPCNQGAREVYIMKLQPDGNYTQITDFTFKWTDTCLSSKSEVIQTKRIRWGQSVALTGLSKDLGIRYNEGILTAFYEANKMSVIPGYAFDLFTLDDANNDTLAENNTRTLVQDYDVFGLVGYYGAGPSEAAARFLSMINSNIPFVGPLTGDPTLRVPFRRNIINVHSSYIDEAGAIVSYLNSLLISHISVFYQDAAFGHVGKEAVRIALNASGFSFESEGSYPKDTLNIHQGIADVFTGKRPSAVIMIGTYDPISLAIHYARQNFNASNVLFFTLSNVGQSSLAEDLAINYNETLDNIFVSQVVPPPRSDSTERIVQRYLAALADYDPDASPTFTSLEGYVTGLFVVEATSRLKGKLSSTGFVDIVYDSQLFVLEGMRIGSFSESTALMAGCNQGGRAVWLTKYVNGSDTMAVPGATFTWSDGCMSSSTDIQLPIIFAQSAPLTGLSKNIGLNFRAGILAAFSRFNRNGGLDGRQVRLLTYDDDGLPELAVRNTNEMLSLHPTGFIGYVGTAVSAAAMNITLANKIPLVGPYTGAQLFRHPCNKYLVNMRSSYFDEAAAIISFLMDDETLPLRGGRTFTNISMFYQHDSYGTYYDGVVRALNHRKRSLTGLGAFEINTVDVKPALKNITDAGTPDAIIVFGAYAPCAEFIREAQKVLKPETVYVIMSNAGANSVTNEIANMSLSVQNKDNQPTVYISTVVPPPNDPSFPLAASYMADAMYVTPYVPPNFVSFEGYALGRFVTRALQLAEGGLTPRSFTEAMYEKYLFNLDEYYLGPYTLHNNTQSSRRSNSTTNAVEDLTCVCSQGGRQVWLNYITPSYNVTDVPGFQFIFDTCGAEFEVLILQEISDAIRGIVLAIAVLSIVVVVICFIMVILFKNTKTMTASSPVFLLIILFGGLLLSISPFFAVNWITALGLVGSNNVCMTWIWMLGLGFTLFFAPLAVKTYRVYRIFNNRVLSHVITLKDSDLMLYLAVPIVMEVIILIVWTAVAPAKLLTVRVPGTLDQTMQLCTTIDGSDQPLIITQAVFFGLVALAACFFAFRTRNIKYGAFKESTEILFAAYNLTFLSVILVPLHAGLTYYVIPSTIIRTIGVVFQVLVSVGALFGMKLYRIITNNEKMSTTTRSRGSSRYSSRGPLSFSSTSGSSHSHGKTTTSKTTTTTSSSTTKTSSRSTKSSSGTTTTTTTTSSSSSSPSGDTSSSTSDSDSSSSSGEKEVVFLHDEKPKNKPPPKATASAPPKHVSPGAQFDSVPTEPSTEESSPEVKPKKKHKRHHDEEEHASEPAAPVEAPKSAVSPKSPTKEKKGETYVKHEDDDDHEHEHEDEHQHAEELVPITKKGKKSSKKH